MKKWHYILGVLSIISLILVLLISAIEIAVYADMGFFQEEYKKYQVADTVSMEMDDLMEVTEEMLSYLRGDRDDLHITTIIDGETREFFNDREIAHMEDVRNLFIGAIHLRYICLFVCIGIWILLFFLKVNLKKLLPRSMQIGAIVFTAILALLAILFASDFTRYFTIFHQIFFSNDLWILNPNTDLLINIVPEPFFVDMAARIGILFGFFMVILLVASVIYLKIQKRKEAVRS